MLSVEATLTYTDDELSWPVPLSWPAGSVNSQIRVEVVVRFAGVCVRRMSGERSQTPGCVVRFRSAWLPTRMAVR